ncbi:DUF421 domain-containing protein [Virgibacillus kekensis]|uniref:DUF421 domain-containing protein n=1 Tax=Virgibacillus kekensis TaxID=202261 RepID=A0ABV9DMF8_9BACI
MENMLPILVETLVGFTSLLLLTKVLGKTQITQLTAFDFVAALVLGELVGNALFDDQAGVFEIIYAVFIWGVILYVTEIVTQKFKGTRNILEGKPSIIIHQGKLDREEMRRSKLDINQLQHLLRAKDAFSIQEVEYAVLETDGSVSVLKKHQEKQPTNGDMNIPPSPVRMPMTIINDGEILWDNLKEAKLTEEWVYQELKRQNVPSINDVFFAEWVDGADRLFIVPTRYENP